MVIPQKYHQKFQARRGEVIRDIEAEVGNVGIKFPRSGEESETVTLRGHRDAVDAAKKLLLQRVQDWV